MKDDHVEDVHEQEEGKEVPSFELSAVGAFAAAGDQEDTGDGEGPTEVERLRAVVEKVPVQMLQKHSEGRVLSRTS